MSSRPLGRSVAVRPAGTASARTELAQHLHVAALSAAAVWRAARGPAMALAALTLAAAALTAMVWLLYELGSWWIEFGSQPFPGAGVLDFRQVEVQINRLRVVQVKFAARLEREF